MHWGVCTLHHHPPWDTRLCWVPEPFRQTTTNRFAAQMPQHSKRASDHDWLHRAPPLHGRYSPDSVGARCALTAQTLSNARHIPSPRPMQQVEVTIRMCPSEHALGRCLSVRLSRRGRAGVHMTVRSVPTHDLLDQPPFFQETHGRSHHSASECQASAEP